MTYVSPARIEELAAEIWRRHRLEPGFDTELLLDELELDLLWETVAEEAGREVLGQLVPELRLVTLNESHRDRLEAKQGRVRRFTLGHEIGHWMLHCGGTPTRAGGRPACRGESPDSRERQADMYAAALLMPEDRVLAALPASHWSGWPAVYRLADAFVVTVTAMVRRLEELRCVRRDRTGVPVSDRLAPVEQDALFD
ncbi:MAG: ImmA/IrrE family metallo-endopeptidase [Actinoallomurus sp.]